MFLTLRSNLWYLRCIEELLKMLCCRDGCFRLELMVRANVSFAKESIIVDYFVELIDLAKSNGNFIYVNYYIGNRHTDYSVHKMIIFK